MLYTINSLKPKMHTVSQSMTNIAGVSQNHLYSPIHLRCKYHCHHHLLPNTGLFSSAMSLPGYPNHMIQTQIQGSTVTQQACAIHSFW